MRRRWPGWKEATEGHLAALLRPTTWRSMADLTRDITRAGRVSAAKHCGGQRVATPFDSFEHTFLKKRNATEDKVRRRFSQRCILEVRKEKKRWRAQETWREATRSGGNAAKTHRKKPLSCLLAKLTCRHTNNSLKTIGLVS